MKTTVNNITINLFAYLLICAFGLLLVNNACNYHTHRLPDGTVISHAHPYSKSADDQPFKSHHHSETELVFVNSLDLLFPLLFLAIIFINLTSIRAKVFFLLSSYSPIYFHLYRGRAPPSV